MNMVWLSRCVRLVSTAERLSKNLSLTSPILPYYHVASCNWSSRVVYRHRTASAIVSHLYVQPWRLGHSQTVTSQPSQYSNGELSSQEKFGVEVTPDNYVVKYVEEENEFFHEFIESQPSYQKYILLGKDGRRQMALQTEASSAADALPPAAEEVLAPYVEGAKFKVACKLRDLEFLLSLGLGDSDLLFKNGHFITLCDCLVQNLSTLSGEDLFRHIEVLSKFNFRRCIVTDLRMSRMRFARSFNEECVIHCSQWDLPKLLLAADFFYSLRTSQWSSFLPKLFKVAEQHLATASKEELVLLLYHANLARRPPWSRDVMNQVASTILEDLDALSVQECGIVCLSFFKTKQPLKHPDLLVKIAQLLRENILTIDPVCLSAIFKCLQMSTNKTMVKRIPEFFEIMVQLEPEAQKRIGDLTPVTTMHVLDIYHHLHNVSESLVHTVCEDIIAKGFGDWRMKDLARLARILGNLQLDLPSCHSVLQLLVAELESERRREELSRHLDCLLMALLGLAFSNVFPPALVAMIFSEEGLRKIQKAKMDLRRDLHQLSESVRMEASHCVSPSVLANSAALFSQKSSKQGKHQESHQKVARMSERDTLLADVASALMAILGGPDCLKVHTLLSSFEIPDIELQVHPCGKPIPVTRWQNGTTDVGKSLASKNSVQSEIAARLLHMATAGPFRRIAVLIHGHNAHYTLRTVDGETCYRLLGYHAMKGRQLQKLGYDVVQIPFYEFAEKQEKRDYIKMKVFGEIHFDDLD